MSGKGRPAESRVYINPFVRVAYDEKTLSWLSFIRRPERLYAPIHDILNYFVGFPETQARFLEEPGETVTDHIWEFDNPAAAFALNATEADLAGHYVEKTRKAAPGGYCASPNLLVINEKPEHGPGAWSKIHVPSPPKA